jgi:histone-lysine N-methyltransferase SETMAR
LEDRRISAKSIPKNLGISRDRVGSIIHEHLDMRNVTKRILFLHTAPAHRTLATQKKLAYLGFQCLDHPPYSLDLTPSDYHLFPGLKKKQLKGRHLSPDAEVIAAAETWLEDNLLIFLSGLQRLGQRAKKCMDLRGEYVE